MKKTISSLLILCLLLSLLAACGGGAASAPAEGQAEPAGSTEVSAAEDGETAAAPAQEGQAAEPASAEEPAEEEEIPPPEMPVANHDVTLSMWYEWPPYLDGNTDYNDPNDFPFFQNFSEVTGLDFEFQLVSMFAASEQFNLLVAADSLPEICCTITYFSGSLDSTIENDIFLDMTDMLPEYAPHYLHEIQRDDVWRDAYSQDGRVPIFYEIGAKTYPCNTGMFLRQDWLDQVNKEVPTTYDQLYDVLTAFKEKFNAYAQIETDFYFGMGMDLQQDFSNIEGQAVYSVRGEHFREYIELMHKWYEEGLLFKDYYIYENNIFEAGDVKQQEVNAGRAGLWSCWCEDLTYYGVDDPDFVPVAMASPVVNEGDEIHITGGVDEIVNISSGWAITTNCDPDKVPLAMQAIDYLYSDEGSIMANWGIEGETFTYQDDGTPRYTDLILNNPDMATNMCIGIYCVFRGPIRSDYARFNQNVVGKLAEYCDVWSVQHNDYKMPEVSMDAADSERYTSLYNDIDTALDENIPKFIIGDRPIEDLDTFIAELESMGLDEMISLEQEALDNYYLRDKPVP